MQNEISLLTRSSSRCTIYIGETSYSEPAMRYTYGASYCAIFSHALVTTTLPGNEKIIGQSREKSRSKGAAIRHLMKNSLRRGRRFIIENQCSYHRKCLTIRYCSLKQMFAFMSFKLRKLKSAPDLGCDDILFKLFQNRVETLNQLLNQPRRTCA